ncbi:MAG: hypothetical protein A2905_01425 [Candidatus Levybacteria bacterium RIFCSPLOWO2_01_FULL_36_10]|nr:MAG: hypothetical protein A2905_01425 [Candidatus Levybacteria bacterium RIFCSPLOWO2_01_FULL_36_10]
MVRFKNIKLLILVSIIILASFLRLWELGSVPSGITNDEAGLIYSTYSISKTGHDVAGEFLPLSINLDNSFSPVSIYLTAPFIRVLGLSPTSGRLPFAVAGILSIVLVYVITKRLFNNDYIALLSAFVMSVSPWHLQITRIAYETPVAVFFFLLGIFIFLKNAEKGNINWSVLPFLFGFYTYHATKIFYLALIPILIFVYKDRLLRRKKELILFILLNIFILISFIFISSKQNVSRQSVLLWSEPKKASDMVNWERDKNTAPFFVREIFNNKPLYYLRVIRENYLEVFSTQFLFLYGETEGLGGIYGIFYRGVMYILELPLLIVGLYFLWREKNNRVKLLLFSLLLISPLSSALVIDKSYVMRSAMLIPVLSIIVGYGIYSFYLLLKNNNKLPAKVILIAFVSVYAFLILEYVYQYHFRYSIYGAESWFRSSKDMVTYMQKNGKSYDNIYIAQPGIMFIFQYGIYNKLEPDKIRKLWSDPWPKKYGKLTLLESCFGDIDKTEFDPSQFLPRSTLYIVPDFCHKKFFPTSTINEVGEPLRPIWKIYEKN